MFSTWKLKNLKEKKYAPGWQGNAKKATKFSLGSYWLFFHDKCVGFGRHGRFALIQYNMQFILCNSALLAHETLFLTKKHYFAQSFQKSAQIATNLKHHNKIVFISKSNLSGGCCLRVCATSHKTTSQLRPGLICQRPTSVKMLQDTKSSGTVRLQVSL